MPNRVSAGNLFASPIDRKIDGVFRELLTANPFKTSTRAKKRGLITGKLLPRKTILKNKLKKKLEITSQLSQLIDALGMRKQISGSLGNITRTGVQDAANTLDRTVGTVQNAQRMGLDLGLFLLGESCFRPIYNTYKILYNLDISKVLAGFIPIAGSQP